MFKVSVIGATGYAGVELVKLLALHPGVMIDGLSSNSYGGKNIAQIFPHLKGHVDQELWPHDQWEKMVSDSDLVFLALPHGHSAEIVKKIAPSGKKVIDLGADFRFKDLMTYEKWYDVSHSAGDINKDAVYGLPEVYRQKIKKTQIVGNPGCYPTGGLLALYPLLKEKVISSEQIIVDAKSGITGSGRKSNLASLYCERNDNFQAYKVAAHRHTPEIEEVLGEYTGKKPIISFTPHLVPMNRGILSTIYTNLLKQVTWQEIKAIYEEYYGNEYFIELAAENEMPAVKWVTGTNKCYIGWQVDVRTNRLVIVAVIDNLLKGAAGQAVQNMNLLLEMPEKTGLELISIYP